MSRFVKRVRCGLHEECGFTLPEMLISMMIMLIVMFALYSIFDMSLRVFSFGNDKTEAAENARIGLERIERELRAAYPTSRATSGNTMLLSGTDSDTLVFQDADRSRITYTLDGTAVKRNSQQVIEYASGLRFQYLDRFGSVVDPSNADVVRVNLDVAVKRGPRIGTQSLTTDVALRNRRG